MNIYTSNPVAAQSKTLFYSLLIARVACLNPARSTDVCLLCVLCIVKYSSVLRADHSFMGVLLSVMCLCVIEKLHNRRRRPTTAVEPRKKII